MENKKLTITTFIGAGILALILLFSLKVNLHTDASSFLFKKDLVKYSYEKNPFESLVLEAKSVYVFDITRNKSLFELNSHAQLPLASLTKIMTTILADEVMPTDKKQSIKELFEKALVMSSNESAIILASEANLFISKGDFVNAMNRKAKELKLYQTYFLNETGLDISEATGGAYGSADNTAKLIAYAIKNNSHLFEATTYGENSNTNPFATTTVGLIASKTGFTDLAGGNLAIIFDAGFNHPIIAVALGSSKEGRFTDIQKLIKATYNYLSWN